MEHLLREMDVLHGMQKPKGGTNFPVFDDVIVSNSILKLPEPINR